MKIRTPPLCHKMRVSDVGQTGSWRKVTLLDPYKEFRESLSHSMKDDRSHSAISVKSGEIRFQCTF